MATDRQATLARAVAVLRRGGVVAVATETYYGLAVDPWNEQALARLYTLKRRPEHKPILVLVADRNQVCQLAAEVPPLLSRLMDRYWPGPLTLVLPARTDVLPLLTAGTGTIGLRHPDSTAAAELISAFGGPLTGTSANISGSPAATTANEVAAVFGTGIDLILDGGTTPGGSGSTLVGLDGTGGLRCLREGRIPFAEVVQPDFLDNADG